MQRLTSMERQWERTSNILTILPFLNSTSICIPHSFVQVGDGPEYSHCIVNASLCLPNHETVNNLETKSDSLSLRRPLRKASNNFWHNSLQMLARRGGKKKEMGCESDPIDAAYGATHFEWNEMDHNFLCFPDKCFQQTSHAGAMVYSFCIWRNALHNVQRHIWTGYVWIYFFN